MSPVGPPISHHPRFLELRRFWFIVICIGLGGVDIVARRAWSCAVSERLIQMPLVEDLSEPTLVGIHGRVS